MELGQHQFSHLCLSCGAEACGIRLSTRNGKLRQPIYETVEYACGCKISYNPATDAVTEVTQCPVKAEGIVRSWIT